IAAAAAFESMVKPIKTYAKLHDEAVDAWAIGPGLGKAHAKEITALVQGSEKPVVVDADALNVLSGQVNVLKTCRGPRLLTPHPGAMKRLIGDRKIARADMV